jgi:hypothetical protein
MDRPGAHFHHSGGRFYKTSLAAELVGKEQIIHTSVEGDAAGAVDASITLCNLMIDARALGLGIVPIGGIRQDSQAMIDLLELPPLTFPIVGVCPGRPIRPTPINRSIFVRPPKSLARGASPSNNRYAMAASRVERAAPDGKGAHLFLMWVLAHQPTRANGI